MSNAWKSVRQVYSVLVLRCRRKKLCRRSSYIYWLTYPTYFTNLLLLNSVEVEVCLKEKLEGDRVEASSINKKAAPSLRDSMIDKKIRNLLYSFIMNNKWCKYAALQILHKTHQFIWVKVHDVFFLRPDTDLNQNFLVKFQTFSNISPEVWFR